MMDLWNTFEGDPAFWVLYTLMWIFAWHLIVWARPVIAVHRQWKRDQQLARQVALTIQRLAVSLGSYEAALKRVGEAFTEAGASFTTFSSALTAVGNVTVPSHTAGNVTVTVDHSVD